MRHGHLHREGVARETSIERYEVIAEAQIPHRDRRNIEYDLAVAHILLWDDYARNNGVVWVDEPMPY